MATMVVIGVVGLVLDQGLQLFERRLLTWRNSAY
jgi:ABC-type nitrate/sulfonate/bicarbonate transport system permease component